MANKPAQSACRFSTRISIRWLPEAPQENTDTIVMSVKDWYLDLRMEKDTGKIDWAIAGQRIVESQEPCMLRTNYPKTNLKRNSNDLYSTGILLP